MELTSTQDRIVAAARTLFGQNGFHRTTTAEIARQAGIAEGTIYRYFRDKKELFVACVEPIIQEVVRRETAVMSGGSPREILRNRVIERTRVIREHLPIFHILFTEGKYHPEIARILLDQVTATISPAEWERIGEAVETGALRRAPNPLIMSVGLTAAIWAMLAVGPGADDLFAGWPLPPRFDQLEEDLADFVCNALIGDDREQRSE